MSQKGFSSVIILLIIVVVIGLGGYLFFQQKDNLFPQEITLSRVQTSPDSLISAFEISFPKLDISSFKSYPIAEKYELNSKENIRYRITLVPINPLGEQIKTDIETEAGGGNAMNVNINEPVPSPDFTITAFIMNSQLWLISADGKSKVKLPDNLNVSKIAGWAPDSKKLLIYSSPENIETIYQVMGEPVKIINFDPNRLPEGFYIVDLHANTVKLLSPVSPGQFIGWINQGKMLFMLENGNNVRFLVFNIDDFSVDTKIMDDFVNTYREVWAKEHISFSKDGKKWVIGMGNTGNESGKQSSSKIIMADFPSPNGKTIDQGSWAEVQSPFISPNGKNLVYTKHEPPSGWHLIVWDGKDKRKIENSRFLVWVDDENFIYAKKDGTTYSKYHLFNLSNSQDTLLN